MNAKMGLTHILSIDFEQSVIDKMNAREAPIEYKVMDMLDMAGIQDSSVDFVVDKGSLDALCSDDSEETRHKVT